RDNVFVYLSDLFFRRFVDPAFRIEMTRRAAAEAEMELVELARAAALMEGQPHDSLEQLISGGFLPADFGARTDGTSVVLRDGRVVDTVRGARGVFLPVADVPVEKVTVSELEGYQNFASQYRRIWQWMDPAVLALRRTVDDAGEQIVGDLHVYPYPRREMGFLDMLQIQKTTTKLAPIPGTLLVAEAHVLGGQPMVAGISDFVPSLVLKDGVLEGNRIDGVHSPFFFGGRGKQFLLQILGVPSSADVSEGEIRDLKEQKDHSVRHLLQTNEFRLGSFGRDALLPLVGNLKLMEAERPAELRIHVGDLAKAKVAPGFHAAIWQEANRITDGHLVLLNRLVTQLHASPDEALELAERILNARPAPLLGDRYGAQRTFAGGRVVTTSRASVDDFRSPFLQRFRGGEFELTTEGTTLTSHFEVRLDPERN
ncbi:MAG: hypothetical protein KDA85_22775, partial [Planctomycetaceae bacterium]|nr:hypothetical protein [Planctomycetaceae bacterium]